MSGTATTIGTSRRTRPGCFQSLRCSFRRSWGISGKAIARCCGGQSQASAKSIETEIGNWFRFCSAEIRRGSGTFFGGEVGLKNANP